MIGSPIGTPIGGVIVVQSVQMSADAGAFTVSGQAAAFTVSQGETVASVALTGPPATLTATFASSAGPYVLTGNGAAFSASLAAQVADYLDVGNATTLTMSAPWPTGSFVVSGGDVRFSRDFNVGSVGSSISGGSFSRGRWRELLEEQRRAREVAQREVKRIERAARDVARKAAAEKRAAIEAARRAEDEVNAQAALLRAQVGAAQAGAGVQAIAGAMNDAIAMQAMAREAAVRRAVQDDEDEAIVLLLSA